MTPSRTRAVEEHGDSALLGHDPVVLVEIVVRAARGGEDLPEEETQAFAVDALQGVVGTGQLDGSLDAGPSPARPDHDRGAGTSAQVHESPGRSGRHERDDRSSVQRVVEDAGVHDRRLDRPIPTTGRHHDESVVERNELSERLELGHEISRLYAFRSRAARR
jgi:hypothetical protein